IEQRRGQGPRAIRFGENAASALAPITDLDDNPALLGLPDGLVGRPGDVEGPTSLDLGKVAEGDARDCDILETIGQAEGELQVLRRVSEPLDRKAVARARREIFGAPRATRVESAADGSPDS